MKVEDLVHWFRIQEHHRDPETRSKDFENVGKVSRPKIWNEGSRSVWNRTCEILWKNNNQL